MEKSKRVELRIDTEALEILDKCSEEYEMSRSAFVRFLLKKWAKARGLTTTAPLEINNQ